METFILAYDICEPRRLREVAKTCENFGLRRQYSVFLCRLPAKDKVRLKAKLYEILDHAADQVIFIPLCARCATTIEAMGRPFAPPEATDTVLVM